MWKMFDEDILDCNECGGPLGPPPKFIIPPPPRPPSMADFSISNCNEEELALKAQQAWDSDMCEALPILDASLYSSQSLQTSAMIAVFSLLLVLVVLISSLFVWKNKRKVQNFLPCKTPTRGSHINGGLPLGGAHAVTYEDPDVRLGHRPLVMRHHNVELLHGKSIHYPSGYPMTRSPPFLVSSSPGPDPYRSNDNVYEELGPGRDSDAESEPPMHSDDDFAEDELSLPGERSFNKAEMPPTLPVSVSTIYHERAGSATTTTVTGTANERNSLLSSSSSTPDASTATATSSSSSHNNNKSTSNTAAANAARSPSGLISGILRHTSGRARAQKSCQNQKTASGDEFNSSTSTAATVDANLAPIQQLYDNRSNLMSLSYVPQPHDFHASQTPHFHSLHHVHHSNTTNNNNNSALRGAPQFYNTLESEVERRNRINAQLSRAAAPTPVATIFRERIHYPVNGRHCPQAPYLPPNSSLLASSMRARTNPRSMERRHRVAAPVEHVEAAYGYAEPVFHENYHYEGCGAPSAARLVQQQPLVYPAAYIMPDYTSGSYRALQHPPASASSSSNASTTYQNASQLYTRCGDSSIGSDSGYSHHTPASSIGRHDYDIALPMPATRTTPKSTKKLSSAFSFGWNRSKSTSTDASTDLSVKHTAGETSASTVTTPMGNAGSSSPNNNSGSSTVTSSLESSEHSGAAQQNNNNNNNNSSNLCPTHTQQA